jgi:hypothetical protein
LGLNIVVVVVVVGVVVGRHGYQSMMGIVMERAFGMVGIDMQGVECTLAVVVGKVVVVVVDNWYYCCYIHSFEAVVVVGVDYLAVVEGNHQIDYMVDNLEVDNRTLLEML